MARKPKVKTEDVSVIGPTPERTMKPDYEWRDGKRIKINSVLALEKAGDISGDAVTAARWWLCDYVFSVHGHLDLLMDILPSGYEPGDIHTFAISRGNAGERIGMIRDRLGDGAHNRLVMMLAEEMSFSEMGDRLFPSKGCKGRRAASAQCAFILEQLTGAYVAVRAEIKRRIEDNKKLALGASR